MQNRGRHFLFHKDIEEMGLETGGSELYSVTLLIRKSQE